jgi:hypothetical protein
MSGLPKRQRGRLNGAAEAAYQADLQEFCARILEIKARLDFEVGTRGWCYLLEGEHIITKGEFAAAERLITCCRKDGSLPVNFCAEDAKRAPEGIESLSSANLEWQAQWAVDYVNNAHRSYRPFSFWDELPAYVEIAVEKSDLKSLFSRVTSQFYMVIQNIGGWADINVRASMMRRFQKWEGKGKRCVLLYCGDHDPGGLQISDFLRANFAELEGAVGWSPRNLVIDRFGLDYDFIEANSLLWIDNLETGSGKSLADPAHHDHNKPYVREYCRRFGARKVEANALVAQPEAGRALCREAILRHVPATAIGDYSQRLRTVREELRQAIARKLGGQSQLREFDGGAS